MHLISFTSYYYLSAYIYIYYCKFKGLENSWERHKEVVEYFHDGLESMGLKLFVKDKVSFQF